VARQADNSAGSGDGNPPADRSVSLTVEVDIIVFTLLLNLGFLKITEVSEFIGQITVSITNFNLTSVMMIVVAVIAYFSYAGSILVGLVLSFRSRNTRPAMVAALISFFVMYAAVFFNAVGHAQLRPAQAVGELNAK
jgi:hypothetical protein